MSTTVRELTTAAERRAAFPVLSELRDHLTEAAYLDRLEDMRAEGYRLFGLFDADEDRDGNEGADGRGDGDGVDRPIAVAGVVVRTNFYNGRHLFVADLVTRADRRSEGHGTDLAEFVAEWGRERGCERLVLESGLWRDAAHRFYEERLGMERYCYTFRTELDGG